MTTGALPAPVRRYLRRPLWWAGLALVVAAAGVATDVEAASRERASRRRAVAVEGSVSDRYRAGADVPVVYDNPVTGQRLEVTARVFDLRLVPEAGAPVSLLVDPGAPGHVAVAGDRYPMTANLWWYAPPLALPLVAWASRRWSVGRTRRLSDAPGPTFAMTAALGPGPRSGRHVRLDVYPLDAATGAAPVCAVRVLSTGGAPLGPPFPVEVKGGPRPLGRVAVRHRERLLWPAGRSALSASLPRPPDPAPPPVTVAPTTAPAGPALPWWRTASLELVALVATLAVFVVVALVTLAGAQRARTIERDGVPVLARVVDNDDTAGVVLVAYRLPGEETERQGTAAADFPSDHPLGRLLPAKVDPRRPATLRLLLEPYEAREPILWSLVPVVAASGVVARRWAQWRAVRRVAQAGPWQAVEGRVVGGATRHTAVALARPGEPHPRCVVNVVSDDAMPGAGGRPVALEAAGVTEPGEWVAVRWRPDRPLAVVGPATGLVRPRRIGPAAAT